MRLNRPFLMWAAVGSIFILSHGAWVVYFIGDSIGDGYRTSELNATRTYNAQLEAVYPLVATGNATRSALVQAMTLNGTVTIHNESPTFAQAGPMTLLFDPNGKFLGVHGIEHPSGTSSNVDRVAAAAMPPQSLSFSIYSLPAFFGERELIAEGTRVYSAADLQISPGPPPVIENWGKTLQISHGFSIGADVYRRSKITGFGLVMRKEGQGFSWEWFDLEDGNVFVKRQGEGRVKVRTRSIDGEEELASIEFLDDVTLRLQMDEWWQVIPFIDKETHNLVVKKGSTFWLAP